MILSIRNKKPILFVFLAGAGISIILSLFCIYVMPLPERLRYSSSQVITYADTSPLYVFLSEDDKWRIPVSTDTVDPVYLKALLRFEDKRFFLHPGFDPVAALRAGISNIRNKAIVSGASTITMQLIRMISPRPRNFFSKLIETVSAFFLEMKLSKTKILQYYCEYLPFGKNIEGIEAASYAFFGHPAKALSPFEIAYLLALPGNPNEYFPRPDSYEKTAAAVARVASRLHQLKIFKQDEYDDVVKATIPVSLKPFPREAEHIASFCSQRFPRQPIVETTIEKEVQIVAEKILASYKEEFRQKLIYNASVVVIENASSKVRACIGNLDFNDSLHHGQVIGFNAERSPGSTLKPFVYALAIDRAIALPDYLVKDIPLSYGNYEPRNYENSYFGLITLENALSYSLNIPFVELTAQIGTESFLNFLRGCGVRSLKDSPGYYGLSAIIGGLEIRLLELTNLYAMLARKGEFLDYELFKTDREQVPDKVLSRGAVYLTRQALMIRDRPVSRLTAR